MRPRREERETLRREFTSNVSHELKTPLTSISGFAELIRSGMTDAEDTRHFADNIYKEARRLIVLVGDIIKLSQLDGGEIPYDECPQDLYEIAKETEERLDMVATSHKVNLELTGEHTSIRGNRQILEEMIYNLVDNGIKYNHEGGNVRIRVAEENGRAVVSVADDGIGIPKDQQSRVFERFYRVDQEPLQGDRRNRTGAFHCQARRGVPQGNRHHEQRTWQGDGDFPDLPTDRGIIRGKLPRFTKQKRRLRATLLFFSSCGI